MFAIISTTGDRDVKDIGKKISITGYVKDSQNNYVSGALVVLTQGEVQPDASNVVKSTTTDSTGTFQFYDLLPGNYGLAVWLNSTTVRIIKKQFPYIETQVIFAGLDPENSISAADINPSIVGGLVIGIIINNPGSGYSSAIPPIITFDGGYIGECTVDNPTGAITGVRTIKQGSAATLTNTSTPSILTNITEKIDIPTYPDVAGTPGSGGGGLGSALVQRLSDIRSIIGNQVRTLVLTEWPDSPWRIVSTSDSRAVPGIIWNASFWAKANQVQNDTSHAGWGFSWKSGMVAYEVGQIIVHPDSANTLGEIFGVDGYYTGNTMLGGDNAYITIHLINTEIISWAGVYSTNEFGNEIVNAPDDAIFIEWAAAVKHPSGLLFPSKAEAMAAIAQGNAARNAVDNNQQNYQTDDDPTLSQQILDFFSGKAEIVKNSINSLFDPNDRYAAGQIYSAVKAEGLELYKQGLISEAELQIAKGFLGRDLIVAPVLANWLGYTGSAPDNILLRTIATIPSQLLVIGYQIADAATTEETWYEALFDGVTQNYGVLTVTPPAWVTNRTFNVGGINKQYINGSWVNI